MGTTPTPNPAGPPPLEPSIFRGTHARKRGFDLKGVCLRGQPPFLLTALHLLLPPARFRNFRSPIPKVDCRAHILEEPRRVTTKKPGISKFSPPYCARVHESGRVYDTKCEVGCCCIVPRANYCSIGDGGLARREQLTANFFPFPPEKLCLLRVAAAAAVAH